MSFVPNLPIPPQITNPQLRQWAEQLREMVSFYLLAVQQQVTDLAAVVDAISPSTGSGNGVTVTVDFSTGADLVRKVVTGQTWVAAGSEIVATISSGPSTRSAEEGIVEGLVCAVENLVVGDGFDLVVHSPNGKAYGQFNIFCVGV